jgi:hypothetical protein
MPYLLGTDEAGYGPNLGPLVIAATAWRVPARMRPEALYERLSKAVCDGQDSADPRLAIADSKQLYQAGGSLAPLERGVLSALTVLARRPATWKALWTHCDRACVAQVEGLPWHAEYDEPVPVACEPAHVADLATLLSEACAAARVGLVDLQATLLFPAAFNQAVTRTDNKAEVLSLATLELARRTIDTLENDDVLVVCDKHGGRARYAALLQHVFPDSLVQVRQETRELGVYRLTHGERPVEFRFLMQGERMLPTALASMTAKYLRELAMRPFNAFWQKHVADLRPTAGYPSDSRRFWQAIRPACERLAIDRAILWRER